MSPPETMGDAQGQGRPVHHEIPPVPASISRGLVFCRERSEMVLETGNTANLVRSEWLRDCNSLFAEDGCPAAVRHPATAGLLALQMHRRLFRVTFTSSRVDAGIPPLRRRRAPGAMGGQLDVPRNYLGRARSGTDAPLRPNAAGRAVLGVVAFGRSYQSRADDVARTRCGICIPEAAAPGAMPDSA